MNDIPNIEKPRTSSTCGADTSAETMGYVTWSSISVGLRPIHSVKTITCGSERSGMASSFTRWMDQIAQAVAKPTPSRTNRRFFAQNSMMRSTMSSPSAPARRALDRRAQPTLRIEQKVAGGDDCLVRGQPREDLHLVLPARTELHCTG